MAGGPEFKNKMRQASGAQGGGGQGNASISQGGGRSHMTTKPSLIGGGAWGTQMAREQQQFGSAAATGSYGAANIAAYANASKQATASNGDFSINAGNKWVNNSRDQSNTNKEQNAGFSDNRINNNVNFANSQQDRNLAKNEGFAQGTTNSFVNNAKDHREDNTAKATQFANATVDKYIAKNKANQVINSEKLDQQIRSNPLTDRGYSTQQSLNSYGDMYRYSKTSLPGWNMPDPMEGVKEPDFEGMYGSISKDIKKIGEEYSDF